jgi:hypothetical protein
MITKLPTTASTKTTTNFTLSCTPKFLQTTLLSALFFLLLGVGESWGQTITEISTTGANSWVCPANVYQVTVETWAAGGGGASSTSNGYYGGGGGGAYSSSVVTVIPGTTYYYSVGAGGAAGATGGDSWFNATAASPYSSNAAPTSTATGVLAKGGGGVATNTAAGATGGLLANGFGSTKYSGGTGGTGASATGTGGGGGGAGSLGNGGNGGSTASGIAGLGYGGGDGASGRTTAGNGYAGFERYGSGGSGCRKTSASGNTTGGAGTQGLIRLTYVAVTASASQSSICLTGNSTLSGNTNSTAVTLYSENFERYNTSAGWGSPLVTSTQSWGWKGVGTNSRTYWTFSPTSPISGFNSLCLYDSYTPAFNSYYGDGSFYGVSNNLVAFDNSQKIVATNYTSLKMNFKWQCVGEGTLGSNIYDYGMICYSTDGTTWTNIITGGPNSDGKYFGQSLTQTVADLALPTAINGQQFWIGFRWINDNSAYNNPPFKVDDITITGVPNVSYAWTGGSPSGGDTPAAQTTSVSPTSDTSYNYTLTAGGVTGSTSTSVTVKSISATPSIEGSFCPGVTTVTGTGVNGSTISVIRSGSTISSGSTTWSGTTWSITVSSLSSADVLTATQTESGKCVSAASTSVTVQSVSTAPAITGTICSSATTVSGTGVDGSSVNVLRSGSSIGTATVSGGVWSATLSGLAANDVLTATQTESGKCVSTASASATVITCSPPTVSSFSPSSGCANGQLVITGTNLSTVTAVSVNGIAVSSFTINSGTQITATLGAGTTSGTVSVTNPYGTATSSSTYTVYSIGWANTQYPATGTICPSGSFDVYGQVYADGLTNPTNSGAGIVAQLGYSTSNTNPNTWTNWVSTTFNTQSGNNAEYKGTLSGLTAGTYYYAFRYTLGTGCSYTYGGTAGIWNNDNGTLTVNANHAIALSSVAGTTAQTICVNNALTAITYTLSGGATGASVSGLPTGVSASVSGTTLTISGTPSVAGSYPYTVATTGNSCTTASASGTITVGGTINWANLQSPATGTICSSGTFTAYGRVYQPGVTEAPGQGSGITVQLGYSTSNSDPSTWTNWVATTFNVQSGNNDEYMGTLSGLAAGTYYYAFRYKLTASTACGYQYGGYNGGFWNGSSNVNGQLTIDALPTAGTLSGTQAICSNGTSTFSSTISGGTWTLGSTNIATINSTTGVITAAAAGTATMTYTVNGTGGCSAQTATATRTVTVTTAPTAGTLSGTYAICSNGISTFSSTVSGGTWASGSIGIASINASSGAVAGVAAGTATMTYTVTGTGGCSNVSDTRTVTVSAAPSAGTLSGSQSICLNGATTFSSTVSGGSWTSGSTGIATINSSTGVVSGVAAGTANMTYTVTGTGGCSNATANISVTVNPLPTAITISPTSATICNGNIQNLVASGGSLILYQQDFESGVADFTVSTNGSVTSNSTFYSNGSKSILFNTATISATQSLTLNNNLDLTNSPLGATISFSHIAALEGSTTAYDYGLVQYSSDGGTTWISFTPTDYIGSASVTPFNANARFTTRSYSDWISNLTSANSIPNNSLWKSETFNIPVAALTAQFKIRFRYIADGSTFYYGWLIDNIVIRRNSSITWSPSTALFTDAAATSAYTGTSATTVYAKPTTTTTYTATATSAAGCTSSNTVQVSVDPTSVGGTIAGSATVCSGTNSTTLTLSGHTGSVTKWQSSTSSTFASAVTDIANTTTSLTASNLTTTTYYRAVVTSGVCSSANSATATVTVNQPSVAPTSISGTTTICNNQSTTLTANGGTIGTGANYQWGTDSTVGSSIISGETASTLSVSPTSTTTYWVRITNGTSPCSASTDGVTATVTVTPTTTITAQSTAAQSVCNGAGFSEISVTATGTGTLTYQWYSNTSASNTGGTSLSPNGQLATYTPSSSTDGTKYYYCVVTGTCGSATSAVSGAFEVKALPSQATASSTNSCGTATLIATAAGTSTAIWYSDALGNTPVTSSGNITISSPATTSTLTIANASTAITYYAYTYVNGCRSQLNYPAQVELKPTSVYTGGTSGTDTDWFTAGNWSCGSVPDATTNVVIPTAKFVIINGAAALANAIVLEGTSKLTVTTTNSISVTNKVTVASGATFVVQNNASLVQEDEVDNEGNITVQKSTPDNRLLKIYDAVLWSSPVASKLKAVSPGTTDNFFLQYVTSNDSWATVATPASHDAIEGKGYLIRTPTITGGTTQVFDFTTPQQWNVNFTGVPNNGNVTISAGTTGTTEKYLLVGNPYPSAIDIAAFRAANQNITGVFYFFRKPNGMTGISAYGTLDASNTFASNDNNPNSVGVVNPGGFIPSGQGFFVAMKSNDNNGEVYFTNAMRRANDHGTFNRMNTNLDTYRLLVQTPVGGNSQFINNYDAETTSGYDVGYDAIAFTDGTTDLSMIMNSKNYRIQSRGQYNAADVIPVQFKTGTAGEHRIKLQDAQGVFAADQMVIIKDNLTGVQHNLTANGDYVFTATAGTFTNRFEVVYQQAYYTALQANSCGTTIANMNSLVYADLINGATGYRFKVVNNTTAAVQTIDRPQHWFAFNMLSAYDYNTPYTISVQVQKDGVWTGYYGATCTVNSPNIANTGVMQINPSQCGATLATLGTVIATTPVSGATGYKFRITNTTANASGTNMVQEITRSNHWFTLGMLSRYNYGSSYTVEVAVKTTGAFTPYGNACTVYSPSAPTLASCGQTVATATTLVRTTAMTLATQYRFQVTRMSTQETITFDTANFWFSFRVNVPGYAAGEQYGVRVAVMTAGAWSPYGDACDITAPIATARTIEEAAPSEANLFKPVAYPNPFKSAFSIALATPFQDDVTLVVYDLQGRLIEKQTVPVSLIDTIHIGANYQMGDYMLVVSQGSAIESMLLHKE